MNVSYIKENFHIHNEKSIYFGIIIQFLSNEEFGISSKEILDHVVIINIFQDIVMPLSAPLREVVLFFKYLSYVSV